MLLENSIFSRFPSYFQTTELQVVEKGFPSTQLMANSLQQKKLSMDISGKSHQHFLFCLKVSIIYALTF